MLLEQGGDPKRKSSRTIGTAAVRYEKHMGQGVAHVAHLILPLDGLPLNRRRCTSIGDGMYTTSAWPNTGWACRPAFPACAMLCHVLCHAVPCCAGSQLAPRR